MGLISDVKQAFLNVFVGDHHRDFMRFLWFDNPFSSNPKLIVMRFLRVMFGIISSPFLLNGTIRFHLQKYRERLEQFVAKMFRDLYVDDSTSTFNTVQKGYKFYEKAKTVMKDAGCIYRLKERFSEAEKHPIIISRNSHFCKLVIIQAHAK